jgi:hypothetical protein
MNKGTSRDILTPMSLPADLNWLERIGHTVNRTPEHLADGRVFYDIDGLPRTPEQIEQWVLTGHDPVSPNP